MLLCAAGIVHAGIVQTRIETCGMLLVRDRHGMFRVRNPLVLNREIAKHIVRVRLYFCYTLYVATVDVVFLYA